MNEVKSGGTAFALDVPFFLISSNEAATLLLVPASPMQADCTGISLTRLLGTLRAQPLKDCCNDPHTR